MVSSTAYYIKFDGFSPTFFNQFLVVDMTVNSYTPYLVMNVDFGMSEGQILS